MEGQGQRHRSFRVPRWERCNVVGHLCFKRAFVLYSGNAGTAKRKGIKVGGWVAHHGEDQKTGQI